MQCSRKRKRAGSTRSSLPTDQRRRNITMPGITALKSKKTRQILHFSLTLFMRSHSFCIFFSFHLQPRSVSYVKSDHKRVKRTMKGTLVISVNQAEIYSPRTVTKLKLGCRDEAEIESRRINHNGSEGRRGMESVCCHLMNKRSEWL